MLIYFIFQAGSFALTNAKLPALFFPFPVKINKETENNRKGKQMTEEKTITEETIAAFERLLLADELSAGRVAQYVRALRHLAAFLDGRPVAKELILAWKETLCAGYAPVTVNAILAAANRFFAAQGWDECHVKALRIQRRVFRSAERELTKDEYVKLVETAAARGQERLALAAEAICATGIRVSELRYVTVEALHRGRADVALKGKVRTILLPGQLCRKLLKYAKRKKIASGEIFLTRSGKSLSRKQIWAELKTLCQRAGVAAGKVFPHNLRHLFARTFYKACRDIVKLADVLGHSSIETTRIYLISTGEEHASSVARLGLMVL